MYERFEQLLDQNNVTAYQVSKETGIPASTFSDWKSGRSHPGAKKIYLLAKFFGVPMEYFLEDKETA